MIIKQDYLPKPHPARPGLALSYPTSITIHWIGPYPKQSVYDPRYWWLKGPDGKGLQASSHYIVKDDNVLECIPTGEVAWHCGSTGNFTSIGIEVIPMNIEGEFSTETIDTLRALLSKLPKLELKRHYDWTGKDCPRWYTPAFAEGEARWEELKKELSSG